MTAARNVRVELRLYENVCEGGTRRVSWLLEQQGRWLPVSQLAGVEFGERESVPGLIWQQRALLSVPVGQRVMQIERRPTPMRHTDPMDYLFAEQITSRVQSRRRVFLVQPDGTLKRVPAEQSHRVAKRPPCAAAVQSSGPRNRRGGGT